MTLALISILMLSPGPGPGRYDSVGWALLASADFDGDGTADTVLGATTDVSGAYRAIRVESPTGKELLHVSSEQFFQSVQIGAEGFPRPVLITTQAAGANMLDVRVFIYRPGAGRLETLKWGDWDVAFAREVEVKPGIIILYTWEGTPQRYRLHGQRLTRIESAGPLGETGWLGLPTEADTAPR